MNSTGRLPNFCIIGAMRSGTTALARYLGRHPEVFMAPEKEVRYFDRYFDRGSDWYANHFRRARRETAVGEATPYMHDRVAVARMAEALPAARLIAILRDPVDRAYSHYWLRRALGREKRGFPQAIATELNGTGHGGVGVDADSPSYLGLGRYLEQLVHVCDVFPRHALLVLTLEGFRGFPADGFAAVCGFLGVDSRFIPGNLGVPMNRHVTFRSVAVRRATRRLPRKLGGIIGKVNTVRSTYPPMDPDVRRQLQEYFQGPNAALSAWLGKDLSAWKA